MRDDFCAFILTHGRPDNVVTYKTLRACRYTGDVFFIVDNEDAAVDRYRANFGAERVIVFDKKAQADKIDEANNFDNRKVIVHARNASFDIAESLGVTHFVQFDDDYYFFGFRGCDGAKTIRRMDAVFDEVLDFLDSTPTLTVAFAQGGDSIGGFAGVKMKRKAMNSFFCRTDRRFTFLGSINEDVNTYVVEGTRGGLFFTFTGLQLDQKDTQSQGGGMTGHRVGAEVELVDLLEPGVLVRGEYRVRLAGLGQHQPPAKWRDALDHAGNIVLDKNITARPDAFLKAIAPFRPDVVVGVERAIADLGE